jgi:hypothetical protein
MKQIIANFFLVSMALSSMHVCRSQTEWPKSIVTTNGMVINLYQPQMEALVGNTLKSRSAISILEKGSQDPIFGVFWSLDLVETNRDTREVVILAAGAGGKANFYI